MYEQEKVITNTILSDNNTIKAIINQIINNTANLPDKFGERLDLAESLHLAMFNRLSKEEDKLIISLINNVVNGLSSIYNVRTDTHEGMIQKKQAEDYTHKALNNLNRTLLVISNKVLNTKFTGELRY